MAFKFLSRLVASRLGFLSGLIKQSNGAFVDQAKDGGRRVLTLCNAKSVSDITTFPAEVLKSNGLLMELFEAWMVEHGKRYSTQEEKLIRFENFKRRVINIHIDSHIPFVKRRLNRMADLSVDEYAMLRRR